MQTKWNLLESLIHTANCDGVIPVDVFMSGDRFDNDNTELGWNEFTLWQQTQDDLEGNVGLDNICPGHADEFGSIEIDNDNVSSHILVDHTL